MAASPARNLVRVETPASKEVAVGGAAGGADDDSGAVNTDFSNTEQQVTARV